MPKRKIAETRVCKKCQANFDITDADLDFYDKASPTFNWIKYNISLPVFCPDCSLQRRLAFRNERNLYRRKSDLTWKDIVSIYSPDKPYKAYEQSEWWSDKWNPLEYGREFDFNRWFFEQFDELIKDVPVISLIIQNGENSDYTNYTNNHKNCYLTVWWEESQNCMYWNYQFYTNDCLDFYWIVSCTNCYEALKCYECNNLYYSQDCKKVTDGYFCKNCVGCNNCIWCYNLTNKSYQIFNKQVTKEEYDKLAEQLSNYWFLQDFKKKVNEFFSKRICKFADITSSENCSGEMIIGSKNCQSCYSLDHWENWKDIFLWFNFQDAQDSTLIGFWSSTVIGSLWIMSWTNIYYSAYCWGNNSNVFYSMQCYNNNSNIFWCVWLRDKQYCIFNKQYTKEQYEELVPKIIEHMKKVSLPGGRQEWWEFFPMTLSPFWYNETVAMEYYPESCSDTLQCVATADGRTTFNWSNYESPKPTVAKVIPASKLPDDTMQIPDDITNWAIECEITSKPFRILKQELDFYRKHNLPIPRRHPDQRHLDRLGLWNPKKLHDRKCDKCWSDIKTTYSPEREEIIYCENCYNDII